MSNPINDGGCAFPCSGTEGVHPESLGMSLRDYFAAAALQGELASYSTHESAEAAAEEAVKQGLDSLQYVSRTAYMIADAMLAERSKTTKTP